MSTTYTATVHFPAADGTPIPDKVGQIAMGETEDARLKQALLECVGAMHSACRWIREGNEPMVAVGVLEKRREEIIERMDL